jgi:hypothetical protein
MMVYKNSLIRLVLVAACILVLGTFAAADQTRPMTGSFAGSGFTFTGQYAHMGSITGEITSFTPTATGAIITSTAIAANGDEVTASSVLTITGVDPVTGLLTFVQELDFTGGTGRFADVTGHVQAIGEVTSDLSSYSGELTGWIRY